MRLMMRFSKAISMLVALSIVMLVMPIEGLTQQQRREAKKKNRPRQTPTQYLQKLAAKENPQNPFIAVTVHAIERYMENKPAQSDVDRTVRAVLDKHGTRARPALQRMVANWKAVPKAVRDSVTPPEFREMNTAQPVRAEKVKMFVANRFKRVPRPTYTRTPIPDFKPKTSITALQPAAQYPGGIVRIQGAALPQGVSVKLQSTVWDINATTTAEYINGGAVEFKVSQGLPPGEYYLSLRKDGQEIVQPRNFTVRAPQYRVRFSKMHCIDESDPECDCDEIVSAWAISADDKAWSKTTGEYEDIGDGDDVAYRGGDQVVYPISGEDRPVKDYFALGMNLYEWDAGDAKATEEVLDLAGDLVQALASLFGAVGAIIGQVINWILDLVGVLVVMFGGDPDNLGYAGFEWSVGELQQKTATPDGVFRGTFKFRNNDDTGSYDVEYAIRRIQPQ